MSTLNATQGAATTDASTFATEVNFSELTPEQKVSFIQGVRAAGRLFRQVETLGNLGEYAPCEIQRRYRGGIPNQALLLGRALSELDGDKFAFIGFDAAITSHLYEIESVGIPDLMFYELVQSNDLEVEEMKWAGSLSDWKVRNAGVTSSTVTD